MSNNVSFGVFPSSSAVKSRSTGELQALYYATTTSKNHAGRIQLPEDRGENFDAIHKMGQKNTKYMKYQIKKAPLVDRSACKYHQEFVPKPLGDCVCNRELAKTFKGGLAGGGKIQSNPSFGKSSRYVEDFCGSRSTAEMRGAKAPSQGPHRKARTQTLGGTGDLLELSSCSHGDHIAHPQHLAKPGEILIPKPNLTLAGRCNSDAFKTNYSSEFRGPAAQKKLLMEKYGDSLPNFEGMFDGMQSLNRADDDEFIYQIRRACFLSPGQ